ncbi:hypothetical protein [Neobacillus mesonae]|uniref:hypothetical protein n=1 Tax=Neobacillus mesonae TaxID=1193713 RepID=UPI0025735E17|nr:hypothetical protein [Neobacillus mesonae]
MPTDKARVFTLARFGDIELFKKKFILEEINKKDENGLGLLNHSIAVENINISLFLKITALMLI